MISLITFGIVIILIYISFKFIGKTSPLPQGTKALPYEKGLPIIGVMHQIRNPLSWYLTRLGKKHGPLFKIKYGMRNIVVINNYDTMRKTLKKDGENFSGRFNLQMIKEFSHDSGILYKDGEVWAKQRSFVLTVLHNFGLGKSKSIETVQNECQFMLKDLKKEEGKSLDFSHFILYYTANIISKFVMNHRFGKDDKRLTIISRLIHTRGKEKSFAEVLFMMFPIFDRSNLFLKFVNAFSNQMKLFDEAYNFLRIEMEEHLKRLNFNSDGEDLIDRFLLKQHEMKNITGTVDTFTEWQCIRVSYDLFAAGFETTSTTLGWSCLFLSRHPEIQNKVYCEIIDQIGEERMVTMNDKTALHYTQAVMDEIFRLSSVVQLGLPHKSFVDSTVDGYFIPKNSVIFTNLLACHFDPTIWENPMKFNPDRFLTVDSNGMHKYTPRKELIPFGMGKRQCLGESLARMEYFIFFTSIFQQFEVSFSEEISDKKYAEALNGNEGVFRFSIIKQFIFKSRLK